MKTIENNDKSFLEITKAEIKALLAFASKDSTRPQLSCVYFAEEPEKGSESIDENIGRILTGSVVAVATDGHTIIAMTSAKRASNVASAFGHLPPTCDPGFMIPRGDLERVAKMLGAKSNALLSFCENAEGRKVVDISANGAEMLIKCVDAKYVPYTQVIPAKRAWGHDAMPEEKTTDLTVGISAKYLARLELVTAALEAKGEGVTLQIPSTSMSPVRFDAVGHETSAVIVIMPMRI